MNQRIQSHAGNQNEDLGGEIVEIEVIVEIVEIEVIVVIVEIEEITNEHPMTKKMATLVIE